MAIKQIIVLPGQSIWDIAVQEYGSASGVAMLMVDNEGLIDFNSTPAPGLKLQVDDSKIIDPDIVQLLTAKGIKPANAVEISEAGHTAFTTGFTLGFK